MNSPSWRTRSTSAVNASTTSVLTLIPRPRATTSTVVASSSGIRMVVVFFVMTLCYQEITSDGTEVRRMFTGSLLDLLLNPTILEMTEENSVDGEPD